jgi:asparagine synthase (glutamine-hydrolysing)
MLKRIAHRCPDGSNVWRHGPIGLGYGKLAATPESIDEILPVRPHINNRDDSDDLALTCDVRLDNRKQLAESLGIGSLIAHDLGDGELLMAAYQRWGEQCPRYLLGDFSFAIWDGREKRLFCARDHFGVKPFYYFLSPRLFAFGSEIKAVLGVPGVTQRLNEVMVGDYLTSLFEDTSITFYRDIRRLPPGHSLTVSDHGIAVSPYWSLDRTPDLNLKSDEEYIEAFRDVFTESVRCRMRSAFPIGSFLSGGLDSSSIACTARNLLRQNGGERLHTFSAIFKNSRESDESPFIQAVLDPGGMIPYFLEADEIGPLNDLDPMQRQEDGALYAFNLYINWNLNRAAHEQGVRVMLDGFDGDTTISHGVGYLSELAREGRWIELVKEAHGYAKNFDQSFWSWIWTYAWNFGLEPKEPKPIKRVRQGIARRARYALSSSRQNPRPKWRLYLNPEFVQRAQLTDRRTSMMKMTPPALTEKEAHYQLLRRGVMPYTLEILDKAASAFSLEPRYPFWDKRLVEFCLSLPPQQKVKRGLTRMIMRRAMTGVLPRQVQWRVSKSNMSYGFQHGLKHHGRERMNEILADHLEVVRDYVDVDSVQTACRQLMESGVMSDESMPVWKSMMLASWLNSTSLTP